MENCYFRLYLIHSKVKNGIIEVMGKLALIVRKEEVAEKGNIGRREVS